MRKIILMVAAAMLIIPISQASAVTSGEPLLTGGNFEGGLVLTNGPFTAGAPGQYNKWLTNGWEIASGGQVGATDDFGKQGIGSGLKILQAVDAKGLEIKPGRRMKINFDYILGGSGDAGVQVIGLYSGDQIETVSGGAIGGSSIFSELLAGTDGWERQSHNFIVEEDYDAIAVVFSFSGDGSGGIRGIDNINLTALPEPATMLAFLMGTGMIGRYLKRRRA